MLSWPVRCFLFSSVLASAPRAIHAAEAAPGQPSAVRGAVYVSARAYNAPQMWRDYRPAEARRDCGYAAELHLNALRIWVSYEYWKRDPAAFQRKFDDFATAASAEGIRLLVSLFENDGIPPTEENLWLTDPLKAAAIQSPGRAIAADSAQWEGPRRFVRWFLARYGDDPRMLAIEVMNEPSVGNRKLAGTVPFAEEMYRVARAAHKRAPLTIGFAKIENAEPFYPLGLDLIEVHENFPPDEAAMRQSIEGSLAVGRSHHLPIWLTEWQRLRPSGTGWENQQLSTEEKTPHYAPVARVVAQYPVGSFFWSLMIKRAYLLAQRKNKTINGLFWEDGAVWSLEDARAIAGDSQLQLTERRTLPAGFP